MDRAERGKAYYELEQTSGFISRIIAEIANNQLYVRQLKEILDSSPSATVELLARVVRAPAYYHTRLITSFCKLV